MKKAIRRLRLREGDILVVRDQETMHNLMNFFVANITFSVPILFAPDGVKRVKREYLEKLLKENDGAGII